MAERLYFSDPYLKEFSAKIIHQQLNKDGFMQVVLDRTAFYPTGGGQPHDTGTLNGVPVIDVVENEDEIFHILADTIEDEEVKGVIDWKRRFDNMQQHSGQHLLSQAFERVAHLATESVHMSDDDVSTIDVERYPSSDELVEQIELLANEIIYENRSIKNYFVTDEQVRQLPMRKPPVVQGLIRIVEIDDFDYSGCGGTHCSSSGEIGIIKVAGWEKIGGKARIRFRCGSRAFLDYQEKDRLVNELAKLMSVASKDLYSAVVARLAGSQALKEEAERLRTKLLPYEADELIAKANQVGNIRVVRAEFTERGNEEIKSLGNRIRAQDNMIFLFGIQQQGKGSLMFGRSENLMIDMQKILKEVIPLIEGRGGGRADFAQGGGSQPEKILEALNRAEELLSR